jgi:1-deoxy-D-xylulose-5-phosphate reductoisomerase
MNAANEVANRAFRDGRCGFLDIERIIGVAMDKSVSERVESLQQLIEVDARTRILAEELI